MIRILMILKDLKYYQDGQVSTKASDIVSEFKKLLKFEALTVFI